MLLILTFNNLRSENKMMNDTFSVVCAFNESLRNCIMLLCVNYLMLCKQPYIM